MEIRYLGHACFELKDGKNTLLIDPFISPNELAKDIDIKSIRPDYILLSHGHEDHLADCLTIAQQSNAQLIANFEIATWYAEKGISNYHPMNIGGSIQLGDFNVQFVPASHSSTLPDGSNGGAPAGFIIQHDDKKIYYSGDTALSAEIQLLATLHPHVDLGIFCIGDNFTMGATEAALAASWFKLNEVIGMHYDTFPYITTNHAQAQQIFKAKNINLHLLPIGNTYIL